MVREVREVRVIDLALSLEAEKKSETLNLNTFGSNTYRKIKCDRVKFNLELDNGEDIAISALTHAVICSPVNSRVSLVVYPHLRRLKLADRRADCQQRIDILVGADFYYDIVSGDVQKGSSGPTAIRSKLGWLLAGPISDRNENSHSYNITSHLVIDSRSSFLSYTDQNGYEEQGDEMQKEESHELKEALKTFWKQEAGGLHGFEVDRAEEPDAKLDIHFDGSRYNFLGRRTFLPPYFLIMICV